MRMLFYFLIIAVGGYTVAHYVPSETKDKMLASLGVENFFRNTLPTYLRHKLSIPENPVAKREKLLTELSQNITGIERELAIVVPPRTDGTSSLPKLPPAAEIIERIERSREFLANSESTLQELEKINPSAGLVQKTGERILEKVLPPPALVCSTSTDAQ
ncbi:MAG: hypothetical protein HY473_00900 [Candidatus Sungbacteria bacterium]|uniref:Uncharacterized protein n=1 Tax=Candidatus Sungiibacteriota bacterium TaxID=2750080 RepID=A0A932YX27_9BACT|nr:hypothetical protein [Candidatus Sungbacteria bacterium]